MHKLSIVLIAVLALACGDDDGKTNELDGGVADGGAADAAPEAISIEDVCGEDGVFVKLINRVVECNPFFELLFANSATPAGIAARCDAELGTLATAGTLEFGTQAELDACLDFINNVDCDLLDPDLPNPCSGLGQGTIASGDGCELDVECAGDAFCDKVDDATCGTCADQAAEFENCFANNECVTGYCAGGMGDLPGMCLTPGGLGEPCAIVEADNEEVCVGRLQCNLTTGRCQRLRVWKAGDSCDNFEEDCDLARAELFCDTEDTNQCVPFLALDDTCVVDASPLCNIVRGETCVAGTCVAPTAQARDAACQLPLGLTCMAGDYCSDPFDGGTCLKVPEPGDACVPANPDACRPNFLLECNESSLCQYEDTPTGTCGS